MYVSQERKVTAEEPGRVAARCIHDMKHPDAVEEEVVNSKYVIEKEMQ